MNSEERLPAYHLNLPVGTGILVTGGGGFLGGAIGTSLGGVFLRQYLAEGIPDVVAYQQTFFIFAFFGLAGSAMATQLRERKRVAVDGRP